ncbi:MAG TPA: tRNA uridine-5-carboxymethylaminomethyl(34) synthesis GTPase MnmE [Arenimonas sp.]|uniref:tRNA uridine-5-carboxymethylaminomethyl(34) synthesis GTPase MnmE n=1 Tax=Arenimonas sp. TaxID=1872635 RepID=UPI002CDB6EEF|nr:tRNA uridine-5-carboxymethylaminomethyl(34) synthesis GTPase MnmE [Arenimonas sp.]HMB58079.1 tRNA uridine-5-carboxymethylaminomethyl(34) synthesis GTPase MnmE [Arenimonas sp.]
MSKIAAIDTIAAIATAPGPGGVGIVRISGPLASTIAETLCGKSLQPRQAHYTRFLSDDGESIDDGIALHFPAPHSYTGEDVVELQAHGSPVLLAQLLRRCLQLGARAARPGEFTERAFLNEKLDLAQAEAVADLIAAGSDAAARAARRSLDGEFSRRVDAVVEHLLGLRVYIEAALDFPDEEIDFLAAPELLQRLQEANASLARLRRDAEHGKRLVDGLHAVIVGAPNAGKSSLMNALAGSDRAIVTDIAGTTRDLLHETLDLDGLVLTLVDTAGLRESGDAIEAEGIRRARAELARADLALAVLDDRDVSAAEALAAELSALPTVLWLHNKSDLSGQTAHSETRADGEHLWLSARTGAGLDALRARLRQLAGHGETGSGSFSARARHLEALARAAGHFDLAAGHLRAGAGELAAEELRVCQAALGELTGQVDADQLLGRIFSSFCIGK